MLGSAPMWGRLAPNDKTDTGSASQNVLKSNLEKSRICLSLVGFNAFNTIRLYKRSCQGCVQTDVLSGNYKTKSAVLFRLTQTKEAPKKRNRTVRVTNT